MSTLRVSLSTVKICYHKCSCTRNKALDWIQYRVQSSCKFLKCRKYIRTIEIIRQNSRYQQMSIVFDRLIKEKSQKITPRRCKKKIFENYLSIKNLIKELRFLRKPMQSRMQSPSLGSSQSHKRYAKKQIERKKKKSSEIICQSRSPLEHRSRSYGW